MQIPMWERIRNRAGGQELLGTCLRGGTALAAGAVAERAARLVRNMVLARILAPNQFGIMALVMAAMEIFDALTDVGIRATVVQSSRGENPEFLNVAWWFGAIRGVGIYLVGVLAAPLLAMIYREPALTSLLRVSFLVLLFNNLVSTGLPLYQRRMRFGPYVWITQGSGLAGTAVSLVTALFIPNVWALVIGSVAEAAICCVASHVLCPIRLSLHIDRECGREVFAFSRGMLGLPVLMLIVMQADIFVIGRVCSQEVLGAYSLASALATIPTVFYMRVVQPMVLPVLSGYRDKPRELGKAVLWTVRLILFFGAPLVACLVVFAHPVLTVVYGVRYSGAAQAFAILCVCVLLRLVGSVMAYGCLAAGQPQLQRGFVLLRALLVTGLIYPAVRQWGACGAAWVLLFSFFPAVVVQVIQFRHVISAPARSWGGTACMGVAIMAVTTACSLLVRSWSGAPLWLQLILCGAICGTMWFAAGKQLRNMHVSRRAAAQATPVLVEA